MKKETKAQFLVRYFTYWCGRLKLPKPVIALKDNRLGCTCCIDNWNDKTQICLKYNTKKLRRTPNSFLLSYALHEVGHLIDNLPYDTYEEKVESEYKAEKFAVNTMKKNYPKQYKLLLEYLRIKKTMKNLKKKEPLYFEAYIRIKDYKDTINDT